MPLHVNTIKNVSKNDEGDFTYLRINFQTPGQMSGKKDDTPFEDPDATFIRSVSYRSPDSHRFDNISRQITELKKEANKREQQKKEMADVVEQGNLVEIKGRRPIKMSEAFVRPALDGKRLPGEVEIHQNGVRYQSVGAQKVGEFRLSASTELRWLTDFVYKTFYSAISSIYSSNPVIMSYWSLFTSISNRPL